jgi:hypothetical protein
MTHALITLAALALVVALAVRASISPALSRAQRGGRTEEKDMTKRHFTDLTAIDCSFGELDDDTQARLRDWTGPLEAKALTSKEWTVWFNPVWSSGFMYRAKPEPQGPVITETVKRIVPGVYGAVGVQDGCLVNVAYMRTADELRAAIATLTEIADALEGGAK